MKKKSMSSMIIMVACAFIFAGVMQVQAEQISTDTGNGADGNIEEDRPDTELGSGTKMRVTGNGNHRKIYMRFDLSSLSSVVSNATLSLVLNTPAASDLSYNVYGLNDSADLDGWGETTFTWNNAPANAADNGLTGDVTLLGSFSVPSNTTDGTVVTFSDADLVTFLNDNATNDLHTLIITESSGASTATVIFYSKEDTNNVAPILDITLNPHTFISTDTGNGADGNIEEDRPDTELGSGTKIRVTGNGNHRKIYMRFDLSSLSYAVSDATLRLVLNTPAAGDLSYNVYGLNDIADLDGWGETTFTWNNAPANAADNGLTGDVTLLGSFSVPSNTTDGTVVTFSDADLVTFLKDNATDDLHTLIITESSGASTATGVFYSREDATHAAPTLEITAIPAPATLLLIMISSGLILITRRSKKLQQFLVDL